MYTPRPDGGTDSRESPIVKVDVVLERDGTPALLPGAITNDACIYLIVIHKNTLLLTGFRRGSHCNSDEEDQSYYRGWRRNIVPTQQLDMSM